MKTKQIVGIIVAGITFIVVCASSMVTNKYFKADSKTFSSIFESMEKSLPEDKYVGVIKVEGTMVDSGESSIFSDLEYDHRGLLEQVEEYRDDENNKGILLYVNSPGGTVNAADELYLELIEYKEKSKRPIYVYMADEACSGGYYVSVAGDKIYANRNTWTGSIGVYMELANYKKLYDKLGIKTTYIKAGKNKTMGSATQDLTPEQQKILQSLVDESYEQFVDVIVKGRKSLTEKEIRIAADGRIYSSTQAKNIGLIDDIKNYEEVVKEIKKDLGDDVEVYDEDDSEDTFSELFSLGIKELINLNKKEKSDTEKLIEYIEKNGSGVPMYYAMH